MSFSFEQKGAFVHGEDPEQKKDKETANILHTRRVVARSSEFKSPGC